MDSNNPKRFLYYYKNKPYSTDSPGRNYAAYSDIFWGGVCGCSSDDNVVQDPDTTYCGTLPALWDTVSSQDPQVNLAGLNSFCGQPFRGQVMDSKDGYGSAECLCYNGFGGVDCSKVLCPVNAYGDPCSGPGNLDFSTTPPTIIGRGYCDATTNRCVCNAQYVGIACELNDQDCSGRGQVRERIEL
jgi:hypothetical protein